MQNTQFDSFGEPIPQREMRDDVARPAASRIALRFGMGLFWSLVFVIVSARAFYFDGDFAAKFQQFADAARSVWATFGV